jgi:hypothetical protein
MQPKLSSGERTATMVASLGPLPQSSNEICLWRRHHAGQKRRVRGTCLTLVNYKWMVTCIHLSSSALENSNAKDNMKRNNQKMECLAVQPPINCQSTRSLVGLVTRIYASINKHRPLRRAWVYRGRARAPILPIEHSRRTLCQARTSQYKHSICHIDASHSFPNSCECIREDVITSKQKTGGGAHKRHSTAVKTASETFSSGLVKDEHNPALLITATATSLTFRWGPTGTC